MARKSLEQRFMTKVKITDSCWEWTGAKNQYGYAVMRYSPELGNKQASHISMEIFKPYDNRPSMNHGIMHSCDNPGCVNPDHLRWGTDAENQKDKVEKGRQLKGERHPLAKLSTSEVNKIKELHSKGMTQIAISKEFNISNQHVSRIINGQRWKEGN